MIKQILCVLVFISPSQAQVCRLSVAGLNQSRRVTGPIHAECPDAIHSAPFGNWGVTSNYGQKHDSHQFDGWCHDMRVCDNSGACRMACADGWYEWNSCTDNSLFTAPNCSLYNSASCTAQETTTGVNVHGTITVDIPVRCPVDTNGDRVPDQGGCKDVQQYSSGTNFLSLYELDPVCCDELVQTVYYPQTVAPLTCDIFGCAANSSPWVDPVFWDSPAFPAKVHAQMATLVNWGAFVDDKRACAAMAPTFNVVSAASYAGPNIAAESIASAFGDQLSPTIAEAAALPLPTSLAGVTVTVRDSRNVERAAPLFYISPRQVNFEIPAGVALGPATVAIFNGTVLRSSARVQVESVAPAIFTQSATGKGLAAAIAVRVAANGSITTQSVSAPVNLGGSGDTVYLLLFGTGIRNRTTLTSVAATIGGANARVEYAGPQSQYVGLDQVNIVVPHALAGRGLVDLVVTVDAKPSNTVQIAFQ